MRNLTGCDVAFLLSVAAGSLVSVGTVTVLAAEMTSLQSQGGKPAPKGRLKFKTSGPVCMCAEGMSERDIEQAMAKLKTGNNPGPDSGDSRIQESSQEKTNNLGVTQ